jgi:hypothetical protein
VKKAIFKDMTNYIDNLCTSILQNTKIKKLDVYSVFRLITSKKFKLIIKEEYFDVEKYITGEDIKDFINNVNPFFNYESDEKYNYYKKYFNISSQIVKNCIKLIEESKKVSFFRVKLVESDTMKKTDYLKFTELRDENNDSQKLAEYEDFEQVKTVVFKFLKMYTYLRIEKSVEILGFNNQHEIIQSEIFSS